jgi:ASC-1-like (ASCH) protein
MDHVAILKKANLKKGDNLLKDILDGRKTIESRWYVNKVAPWNRITACDWVYLKEAGCPVVTKACVKDVKQYEKLTDSVVSEIIEMYGEQIAPGLSYEDFFSWWQTQKNKRFLVLVFLSDVIKLEPFDIDKTGYGVSSAWLVCADIEKLKK